MYACLTFKISLCSSMNAVQIPKIPPLANEQNFSNQIDSESESSLDEEDVRVPSPSISSEPKTNQDLSDLGQHNLEDEEDEFNESHLEHLRVSQQFLRAISMATLDDSKLDASVINEL